MTILKTKQDIQIYLLDILLSNKYLWMFCFILSMVIKTIGNNVHVGLRQDDCQYVKDDIWKHSSGQFGIIGNMTHWDRSGQRAFMEWPWSGLTSQKEQRLYNNSRDHAHFFPFMALYYSVGYFDWAVILPSHKITFYSASMFPMGNDCEIHKSNGSTISVQYVPNPLLQEKLLMDSKNCLSKWYCLHVPCIFREQDQYGRLSEVQLIV